MVGLIDGEARKNVRNWEWVELVLICSGVAPWKAAHPQSNYTYYVLIDAIGSKKPNCLEWFQLKIPELAGECMSCVQCWIAKIQRLDHGQGGMDHSCGAEPEFPFL